MENKEMSGVVAALLGVGANMAGIRSCGIGDIQGKPFIVVPNEYTAIDLEKFLPVPTRKTGRVTVSHPDSFSEYMNKHKIDGKSTIYAKVDTDNSEFTMVGVINDNGADSADWADHICLLSPKQSIEWNRWIKHNKKQFSQLEFAAYLEENLPDITSATGMPSGQEMLEMSLNFEANSNKRFRSKSNLQSGGFSIEFVDEENNDTRSTMKVFERFTIGIPVFDGSTSAYPLEARLKYRENSGKLSFWYELIRHDRVFKTAVAEEVGHIGERTGLTFIYGTKHQ